MPQPGEVQREQPGPNPVEDAQMNQDHADQNLNQGLISGGPTQAGGDAVDGDASGHPMEDDPGVQNAAQDDTTLSPGRLPDPDGRPDTAHADPGTPSFREP